MVAICIHIGVETRWYDCTGYVWWSYRHEQLRRSSGTCKSFHVDFESYDSMILGIKCVGSCFYCGRMGENYQKRQGCHFVRYCGKQCQRRHWKAGHRSSCSTIMFDHRRQFRAEHLPVWGTLSGYDFDLWVHLAGDRAREMPQITHICNLAQDDTSFSRVDAAFVVLC